MVKFLLDTHALAEPVRPAPNAGFLKRLRANEAKLAIASVTLHEALYGVERLPDGKRKEGLHEYMREVVAKMSALPYDAKAQFGRHSSRAGWPDNLPFRDSGSGLLCSGDPLSTTYSPTRSVPLMMKVPVSVISGISPK